MHGSRKQEKLAALKAQISALENHPVLKDKDKALAEQPGSFPKAAPGLLHEIFADEMRNGAAVLGFALGQARTLVHEARPAVFFMQLVHEAQEAGLPYGAGLKSFGFDPDMLVLVRLDTLVELLWAMEEAIACRAVAAVIADVAGAPKLLDFTASRRLSLRAASAGTSVFLSRYGLGREASAAQLRWHVMPETSGETAFDPRAPGEVRWRVRLEKGELGGAGRMGTEWLLGWAGNGFVLVDDTAKRGQSPSAAEAPHGAVPAALGHRLSQTA